MLWLVLTVKSLTERVNEAWEKRCDALGPEERKLFEAHVCNGGFPEYIEMLEAACQKHRDDSLGFKVMDWFQPIFKAIELYTPVAALGVQAYPNPGALVLGGVVGLVQLTSRLQQYQKLAIQMLARMGRKARVFLDYETDIYNDDYRVQIALVNVYGDILDFCQKAVQPLKVKGKLSAKIKNLKLTIFRDYDSHLGKEVEAFENHVEELESLACRSDKKRIKTMHDSQDAYHKDARSHMSEARDHLQLHSDLLHNIVKREEELAQRMCLNIWQLKVLTASRPSQTREGEGAKSFTGMAFSAQLSTYTRPEMR